MDRLLEKIEQLKMKPEHVRKRFAFLTSFAITFVIFAGWMVSLSLNSSPILASDNTNRASAGDAIVDKPLASLTGTIKTFFVDVKDIFVGTNKFEYKPADIEVGPGNR